MKFVSFNVQYGIGLDGKYDPERIVRALEGADVIAMQEVSRNFPKNSQADLPEIFAGLLPDFFHVYGAGTKTEGGSSLVNGRMRMRHIEFGNMVLSRFPILATRNILLPRSRTYDRLNIQRSALECLILTPSGSRISIIAARPNASPRSNFSGSISPTMPRKAGPLPAAWNSAFPNCPIATIIS